MKWRSLHGWCRWFWAVDLGHYSLRLGREGAVLQNRGRSQRAGCMVLTPRESSSSILASCCISAAVILDRPNDKANTKPGVCFGNA